ncbi:type I-C CRISPR-associated endonuclease Cas1c [Stakelama tenebrarum]|uniref:CRISPR-associated endonuclease Cas1 n=1 Tax=Stakelama tenebrarum TaxID=2711215 RepID=A0A6G6Y5R3_9SPHN|nr:type I-C CRISPR-associated endonuclease Cas1c [Sphingosinithalassobacter tenebrarum]QIG80239.1 type I-C CRISPR-associated endonuclease Cas1 [Sphingosinithalassobacter tenebrarum]
MRRHLNTIYVTSEGGWLRKDGQNVVVEVDGEERGRAPLHMIGGIVCFARAGASPALMAACAETGIAMSFLTPTGRFLARVEGPRSGNVLLRRTQHRIADDPVRSAAIVRGMVTAKLANQRTVLRRALRDHGSGMDESARTAINMAERRIDRIGCHAVMLDDVDKLRGAEGEGAQQYFAVFDFLRRVPATEFAFTTRSRRPPLDRMNALLSFLYAMLGHDCRSAAEGVGLDPQIGFLHADRPGRASLALDLMEELRPVLADRLALSLVNRRQIEAGDFKVDEGGAVSLKEEPRKRVLTAWQERKKDELRHPFLGETMPLGLVPHVQALLLARHLRGDIDGYPGFIWK